MSIAMPYKTKNIIKSINPSHKITTKDHHHSVSPNMRPIYNPQKPIKNNLFPKSRISQNNNDNRIQINVIHPKKENIHIENELGIFIIILEIMMIIIIMKISRVIILDN